MFVWVCEFLLVFAFVCICRYVNMCVSIFVSYLPNPSALAEYDKRSIFKRSLTGLNSEYSFS